MWSCTVPSSNAFGMVRGFLVGWLGIVAMVACNVKIVEIATEEFGMEIATH